MPTKVQGRLVQTRLIQIHQVFAKKKVGYFSNRPRTCTLDVPIRALDFSALEWIRLIRIANRVLRKRALKTNQYSTMNIKIRVFFNNNNNNNNN